LVPAEAIAVELRDLAGHHAWWSFSRAARAEVVRWRPDVVLTSTARLPPLGVPIALLAQERDATPHPSLKTRLRSRLVAARSRSFDLVIAPTGAAARGLGEAGVPEGRLRVIPNGVDPARFRPDPSPEAKDSDTFQVIHPGRILPGKGQHHAIDAVARLQRRHKRRVQLTVVGSVVDPVYLDQIRVQAYGQPVRFALDVPDMVPYYRSADVVLHPTEVEEASGFVAIEGMACGCPVIWFDHPTVRESTSGIGVPVPPGDAGALRDALAGLMDAPALRSQIAEQGRRYVMGNLTWGKTWSAYETSLQAIARR
jgi:glycosyltransferase involved in cell wall biosynthesis